MGESVCLMLGNDWSRNGLGVAGETCGWQLRRLSACINTGLVHAVYALSCSDQGHYPLIFAVYPQTFVVMPVAQQVATASEREDGSQR